VHQRPQEQGRSVGADRRRQERALRIGAAGDGRAAQAGRAEGRAAGEDQPMTTMTLGVFQRPERGMGRSFVLSALVHIVLAAVLFLGVRWQVHPPSTVEVELVDAPPPPPPAPVVEAPKPPPPKVEPEVKPPPV